VFVWFYVRRDEAGPWFSNSFKSSWSGKIDTKGRHGIISQVNQSQREQRNRHKIKKYSKNQDHEGAGEGGGYNWGEDWGKV